MSLKSWKQEFYGPIGRVTRQGALEHSLKKWIGLRPKNLDNHRLKAECGELYDLDEKGQVKFSRTFPIDDTTCALCRINPVVCTRCALFFEGRGCGSAYDAFSSRNDPEPMIKRIRLAIRRAQK